MELAKKLETVPQRMNSVPLGAADVAARVGRCTVRESGYVESRPGVFALDGARVVGEVKVSGEGSGVWAGANVDVQISAEIRGKNSGVIIGRLSRLRNLTVNIDGDNILVIFGEGCTSEQAIILAAPSGVSVVFGDDCMLSTGVVVRTDDGHSVWDRATGERLGTPSSVTIGSHVWLGNGSRVGKGVTIGAGSIIGQQSVVTGDVEAHASYAGIPARKIRDGVAWSRTRDMKDIPKWISADVAPPVMEAPQQVMQSRRASRGRRWSLLSPRSR